MAVTFRPDAATGTQHRLNPRSGNAAVYTGVLSGFPLSVGIGSLQVRGKPVRLRLRLRAFDAPREAGEDDDGLQKD